MRFAAFGGIAACIVGISCSLAPVTSAAQSCKCPKNPGPGGGVQCSKDQIATCDPSSGECNCVCDSVQPGKTKADYEAQIFSKVMHTKVDPADLSSRKYGGFVSSFVRAPKTRGTFSSRKKPGPVQATRSRWRFQNGSEKSCAAESQSAPRECHGQQQSWVDRWQPERGAV